MGRKKEREVRGSSSCEEYREAKERMINELTKEIKEISRENDHLMNENIQLIERSNSLSKQRSKKEGKFSKARNERFCSSKNAWKNEK